MKLHLGSFLLGVAVGATGATVARRFRPVALELATITVRLGDALRTQLAIRRENFEDLVAEAKARARGLAERFGEPEVEERRAAA